MSGLVESNKTDSVWKTEEWTDNGWFAQIDIKWNKNHPNNWEWFQDWQEVQSAWYTLGVWNMSLWAKV
jgi:hypothetical protein